MAEPFPTPPRLPYLDGWRGVSILLVLVGHLTPLDRAAHLGVELFFVLSGRLMAQMLIDARQPIPVFLWRRIVRVWPALWTYVALVAAGLSVSWTFGDERHALVGALAAVTFTANYVAAWVSIPYFDHGWSLAVEEGGYLLLALIAVTVGRRAQWAMTVALALAALMMANGWWQARQPGANLYFLYLQTDVRAASLLLPFALYLLARTPRADAVLARAPGLPFAALIVGAWFGTMAPGPWRFGPGTAALALAAATIDRAPPAALKLLAARPLALMGALSFSLYLWQQPFMLLHRAGAPAVVCLLGAGLFGTWSYYRVERPARARLAGLRPGDLLRRRPSGSALA